MGMGDRHPSPQAHSYRRLNPIEDIFKEKKRPGPLTKEIQGEDKKPEHNEAKKKDNLIKPKERRKFDEIQSSRETPPLKPLIEKGSKIRYFPLALFDTHPVHLSHPNHTRIC